MAERRSVEVPFVVSLIGAWGWRIVVGAAALAVVWLALIQLYVVVVPVVLALFIASALEPLVARVCADDGYRPLSPRSSCSSARSASS